MFVPIPPSNALRASRVKILENAHVYSSAGQNAPRGHNEVPHTSGVAVLEAKASRNEFSCYLVALYAEVRTYFIQNP